MIKVSVGRETYGEYGVTSAEAIRFYGLGILVKDVEVTDTEDGEDGFEASVHFTADFSLAEAFAFAEVIADRFAQAEVAVTESKVYFVDDEGDVRSGDNTYRIEYAA